MSSQTSQGSGSKSDDEGALRAMYQQMIDGWNKGNGEALATPYCEDSDLVGFDGTHLKGRQEWRFRGKTTEEGESVLHGVGCAVWSTDSTGKLAFLDNMLSFFIIEVDEMGNFSSKDRELK